MAFSEGHDNQLDFNNYKISKFSNPIELSQSFLNINSLYRSITQIEKEYWNAIKLNKNITKKDLDDLNKTDLIVNKDTNELTLFKNWFKSIKYDTNCIRVVISLTSRCNFNCTYCFESGYLRDLELDMNEKTALKIVSWLKEFALNNNSKEIEVYFYGGEPALRIDLIEFFTNEFNKVFDKILNKIEYNIFTNGSILNRKLVNILKNNNFKKLQITLDGPPEIHNKRRPLTNGKDTFNVILSNTKRILKETNTEISLLSNFDSQNYKSIPELINIFKDENLTENIYFILNPVFRTNFNNPHCGQYSLTDDKNFKIWLEINKIIINQELNCNPLRIFNKGPCSYRRFSHFIFGPNGNIYKCIGFIGIKGLSVGNVEDDFIKTINNIKEQISINPWNNEECINCSLLPLCLGGCRFHSYVENNNITKAYCHKELIERTEFELIKYLVQNNKLSFIE